MGLKLKNKPEKEDSQADDVADTQNSQHVFEMEGLCKGFFLR